LSAYIKVHGRAGVEEAKAWLKDLQSHTEQDGLGQISEVFSGDPPHQAGGCIAQAWSVAELLRVCVQENLSSAAQKRMGPETATADFRKLRQARKKRTSA
jgi:glycogen debranching enzyme